MTAVLGVTPNSSRYAYTAINRLTEHGFPVTALGFRGGNVAGHKIITDWPKKIDELKIITLYVGPQRQHEFYDYIIGLQPTKVIFNPGTENPELYAKLVDAGIEYEEACTLVLLSTGVYGTDI